MMGGHTKEPWEAGHSSVGRAGTNWTVGCPSDSNAICSLYDGEYIENPNATADANRIVDCVNAFAGIEDPAAFVAAFDAMQEALKACRAWHYAEMKYLGSFSQRGDLCAYSEWLTQKALALFMPSFAQADYKPVPVVFGDGACAETVSSWVDELIVEEVSALAQAKAVKP